MELTSEEKQVLRRKYALLNNKDCGAEEYGLQSGKDFDEWFVEGYLPDFEEQVFGED